MGMTPEDKVNAFHGVSFPGGALEIRSVLNYLF
jgi:hypothetical protein